MIKQISRRLAFYYSLGPHYWRWRAMLALAAGATDSLLPIEYDFIISSHMLEHAANPVSVLRGWQKVLRADGHLLLVLPHRDGTFDHRRPVTKLEHLLADAERGVGEDDQTHLAEEINRYIPQAELRQITGRAGYASAENTLVFHRGTTPVRSHRAILNLIYTEASLAPFYPAAYELATHP